MCGGDVDKGGEVAHVFAVGVVSLASGAECFKEVAPEPVGNVPLEEAVLVIYDISFAFVLIDELDGAFVVEAEF